MLIIVLVYFLVAIKRLLLWNREGIVENTHTKGCVESYSSDSVNPVIYCVESYLIWFNIALVQNQKDMFISQ